MAKSSPHRSTWEDRFRAPAPSELRGHYRNKTLCGIAESVQQALSRLANVDERLCWEGLPWRWTWVYSLRGLDQSLAYLIPDPDRPQLAVPIPASLVDRLGIAQMRRTVRDVMSHARLVGGIYWPSWDLLTKVDAEEVIEIVVKRHRLAVSSSAELVPSR
ncbi:MAG: hypothetical protein KF745_04235 [Phycisphaeraceae bacterium]|nr:hypothetical protein [Phycisphaeraceae bacterium]